MLVPPKMSICPAPVVFVEQLNWSCPLPQSYTATPGVAVAAVSEMSGTSRAPSLAFGPTPICQVGFG